MRIAASVVAAMVISSALTLTKPHPIFSSYDVIALRVEAPFAELFSRAKNEPEYAVEGTLVESESGREQTRVPVSISLRGHTSRRDTECSFPKLKIEIRRSNGTDGSALHGLKTLKLGTHCGENSDDTLTRRFGRLQNERAPLREAAVYRLLDALGIPALRARPAKITYVYTDSPRAQSGENAAPLTRNGMLLEDDDDAIARLGGTREIEPAQFTSADRLFSTADAANLAFAEALIGNFDWCVMFTPHDTYRCDARQKLWNVIAVAMSDGKARPLMYDFDVSGAVTGSHRWFGNVFNAAFAPSQSPREIEVIAQLQRTRSLFSRAELDATRQRFVSKKAAAYHALDEALLDPNGRRQMREYLDAFYREIESDDLFYRPVVVAENVIPREAPGTTGRPVCTSRGAIPVGTPVGEPLESRDEMIKVVVLDALWHWGPPTRCDAIQREAVWIDAHAVGRDFPKP